MVFLKREMEELKELLKATQSGWSRVEVKGVMNYGIKYIPVPELEIPLKKRNDKDQYVVTKARFLL